MIISFVNQKGGVGKTTLSIAYAVQNAMNGRRTLLIDADPQQSVMDWSDTRESPLPPNLVIAAMAKKSLHRDLGGLAEGYDDVVIDTPGRSTDITRSAILASDLVIISVTPSPYDIWATEETVVLLEECREFKPDIRALFTINLKITNTLVADEAFQALQQVADYIIILKNQITRRVIFPRSASDGLSVQEVGDDKAAREIEDWYQEIRGVL